ncbi:MAG: hypothetical protein HQ579_01505 [Candidatus Omnitrophica bacterium]|nr:hypothetical protein [Candidatus Omnitrophota bacterium]
MDKIRTCLLFKIIAVALISAFIVLDISWAYPPDHTAPNQNLAAWTNFQQKFDESIFSQSALLASVYDIGAYFFGDAERDLESLPSRFAEEAIVAKLGKPLAEADITIENIVPVEYLKETFPEKLKAALDEIGFKGTLPDEGVVFILYKKGDERFLVQVAKKDDVSPENLPGYEWVISDDYVVKYIPEDYVSAGLKTTRAKKDPPHNDDYYKQKARQMLMDWLEISKERSRGRTFAFNHGDEIKVSAPARIPFSSCLSSDHLSVSLKEGGRVLNMGVTINGIKPCYVKIRVLNTNVLRLRRIDKNAYGEKKTYETELVSAQDVKEYDDKDDPFRLAKIILYISGIIDPHSNRSINEIMDELGGGLEIETGHNLSQGGGSSNILSLSAFIAINKLLGRNEPIEDTSKSVCLAELLTGAMGGWQDHLGPYFPALKELHVQPGKIFPDINELDLSDDTRDALKRRLILWDSIIKRDSAGDDFKRTRQMLSASRGPTIALRKWAYEVHRQMIDALLNGDMELLGRMLTEKYDVAKKASPGLRTEYLDDMIADTRDLIEGAASIGSGGGGYCIFIAKKGREESLKEVLNTRGRVCEWAIDKSGFEIEIKRGGLGILKDEQFIHKWQDIFAAMKEDAEISPEKYQSVNLSFSGTRSGDLDLSIWVPRDLDDDLLTVVLKYLAAEINNRIVTWGALSVTVSSDINGISDRLKHYFDEHYDRAHGNAVISKMTGKYLGGERFVIESEGRSRPELEKQTVADDASQSKALDDVNIPVRIVGVNFGHWMTKVGIMQIDESGKFEYISEPARFRTRSGNTDQLDIHSLSETTIGIIRRQMRDAGLSEDDLYAIGISLGLGAVTHGDNVITHESLDSEDFVDMYDNRLSELLRLVYNSFPEVMSR